MANVEPCDAKSEHWEHLDNQMIERAEIQSRDHFRVGIANDPQPEDGYFADRYSAADAAKRKADAFGFNTPVAVFDHDGNIVYLFLCGQQFKRV